MDTAKNYAKYITYLKTYVKREGIEKLIEWLDKTDVAIAPASSKYHLNEPGGLIQHSINVFINLIKVNRMMNGETEKYSKETLALVSLLHDISKVDYYEKTYRNQKNEQGQWEQVPYYAVRNDNNRLIYSTHEENSVYILQHFLNLTHDEILAIRYHSGSYNTSDSISSANTLTAFKKCPLAFMLNTADVMSMCYDEYEQTDSYDYFREYECEEEGDTNNEQSDTETVEQSENNEVHN